MNGKDRKQLPDRPARPAPPESQAAPGQPEDLHQNELLDEVILETFPATDEVSPFVPASAVNFDSDDVESAGGPEAGIEQVGGSPPEQVDPGAKGAPEI